MAVALIIGIIIQSDQRKKKELAEAWARMKQRVRNARQDAARKAAALKTSIKEALAARQAAARESAARQAAAREAAAVEDTANREAIAREEAAMAEATRTEEASVQVHAVIENDHSRLQVHYSSNVLTYAVILQAVLSQR